MENSAPAKSHEWLTRLSVKLYRYRTLVRRHWWIPLLTVSLGLAIEGWIVVQKPDLFESTGRLIVGDQVQIEQGQKVIEDTNYYYGTQLGLLENPQIRERAEERLRLMAPELSADHELEMTATVVPRTSIFEVAATGTNPEYTQRFVDSIMQEFIAYKREQRADSADSTMMQVKEEMAQLGRTREKAEADLRQFVEKNNMGLWKEQGETAGRFLSELKTQQAVLINERNRLQNLSSEQLLQQPSSAARRPAPAGEAEETAATSGNNSPMADTLNQQYIQATQKLMQAKAEYADRNKVWKPAHPGLIRIKDDIDSIERLLATIQEQNSESTGARIAAINAELKTLDGSIANWETRALEASRKNAEAKRLEDAVARSKDFYDKLSLSMTGLDVGRGIDQQRLTISMNATPARAVPPKTLAHLATGLIGGLIAAFLVLALLDKTDDRVTSSSEVLEQFSEPILGQIPNVETSRTEAGLPQLQPEDERFMYAEAFRSLRSSLVFMPGQSELRSLIVTSAIPGEGKSTIASNLAVTMAMAGARVVLVDADLRRGDMASLFDIDGRFGLSSILRGEVNWRSVTQETKYPTLTLIPRGPVTNQSGELLLAPPMDQMMKELREAFDLVIFNTSPVLATDDAAALAPNFDGTLMVIRAGFTSSRLTQNSLRALYQRQVNVLGLILNCVDAEMPDYYYYRYPKYYAA